MALLDLVQAACGEMGIVVPTQVVGSTDDQTVELLALANREGREFSNLALRKGGWQELHKDYVFTTVGGIVLTGNTVLGSNVITGLSSTAGLVVNTWSVTGNGFGNSVFITAMTATTVTTNVPATLTATGTSFTFGQYAYPIPSDLSTYIPATFWDGSYRWQLLGPLDSQEKNVIKYGISPVGPRRRFWIQDNMFYIQPTPTNNTDIIAYDYYSNGWCTSSTGAVQTTWQADTDVYSLNNDCFILGLIWRYLRAKGLEYGDQKAEYDLASQRAMSRNGGSRDLPLNSRSVRLRLLNDNNIPDTGFGK